MPRKAHGEAFLKSLPPGQQEQLWAFLQGHTQSEARAWVLANCAESVAEWEEKNARKLSLVLSLFTEFWQWYPLRRQLSNASSLAEQYRQSLAEQPDLKLSQKQLDEAAQIAFTTLAMQQQDVKAWATVKRQVREDKRLAFDLAKFANLVCDKLLDLAADRRAQEIAAGSGSRAEKIAALRQEFFKDVDALQASGEVVLPQ
ncbi:MAG TPA: hypothetical protein P5525_11095 [Candidatus Paceibacterota bacterium]|nr:hypothetical protein [Candidatus Paceibacterota bacterium]